MSRNCITTAYWVYAALTIAVALFATGVVLLSADELYWEFWGTLTLLVICIMALMSAFFTKVENTGDCITIVNNFRKVEVPKRSIDRVSWEKGGGSCLKLSNGTFVKLPITGRNEQGVANRVRSWLNQS
jgi:hypothetical protein